MALSTVSCLKCEDQDLVPLGKVENAVVAGFMVFMFLREALCCCLGLIITQGEICLLQCLSLLCKPICFSLPSIRQCDGIHWIVTWATLRVTSAMTWLSWWRSVLLLFLRAVMTERASVRNTILVSVGKSSLIMRVAAAFRASALRLFEYFPVAINSDISSRYVWLHLMIHQ